MGMGEDEFWRTTPRYFALRTEAESKREQKQWEQARLPGFLSLSAHFKKGFRLRPADVYRFPWEATTPDALKEAWKKIDPEILERERKRTEEELARRRALKQQNGVDSRP